MNQGGGQLRRSLNALPDFLENGSCVVPGDFNGDGHVDLFVGTRVIARRYGVTPRSYLLQNDGTGRFRDVTMEKAETLAHAGMVTSAAWTDSDGDGDLDLIVAGEWMPVRLFRQVDGRFVERTETAGLAGTQGWWNSVEARDLNADGHVDLVLGNLGLNSYIRTSPAEPARLYVHDFSGDGFPEQILTSYRNGVSYPLAGRDDLVEAIPELRGRYPTYASFGASRIEDIFTASQLEQADVLEVRTLASAIAVNRGDGTYDVRPLPLQAQFSPIFATLAEDFDGDGVTDLLLAGNFHGVPPVLGRYDASYGLLLRGIGGGDFTPVDSEVSGVLVEGQVRGLATVRMADGERWVIVARNDDTLRVLRPLNPIPLPQ
jgi:hypothetical protein